MRRINPTRHRVLLLVFLLSGLLFFTVSCAQEPEDGVIHLVFWHAWGGYEGKFLEQLVDEFNQTHPTIHVKPCHFLIGDKLMAAIAGGVPPDVATVWDWMLVTMGESGCFVPLNNYLAKSGIGPGDYLPHIWKYGMFSDRKYGVPTALSLVMIFYNKTLFQEVGLDPEHPPRTLEELTSAADRLTRYDPNGNLQRIGFIPENTFVWFWNFGGSLYDPKTRRFTIYSPENLKALRWITSFYREIGMDRFRRFTATYGEYDSPNNPLYTGKLAMREDGQWQIMFIKRYAPSLDYGIMPYISMVEGKKSVSSVTGSFWVIPTGCRHPDEAWKFLHWLISPAQSSRFAANLLNIPPLKESLYHDNYKATFHSRMNVFINLFLKGQVRFLPALPIGQTFYSEFGNVIESVNAGDLTPEEGLKTLDQRLQKALDKALRNLGLEQKPS